MELLAERRLEPVIICESAGTQAEDAQAMQRMYEAARGDLSGTSRQLSQRESLQRLYPTLFVIFIVFFTETPCQMARDWVK